MDPRHSRHPSASIPRLFATAPRAGELDGDDEWLDDMLDTGFRTITRRLVASSRRSRAATRARCG
ncbi:MAG TPA: hypothetical protein VIK61_11065 [Acidimicrobiia bacterium]